MACDTSDADHRLRLTAPEGTNYRLTFGTMLRHGELLDGTPREIVRDTTDASALVGGHRTLPAGDSHEWIANGPIRLHNRGNSRLTATLNGETYSLAPGERLSTSCPTEKRRKLLLGTVIGGLGAVAAGVEGRATK